MGSPIFALVAGVILLTLADCDVRIRPIWEPASSDSAVPDPPYCPDGQQDPVGGWAGPQNASADGGSVQGGALATTTGGGTSAPVTVDASDSDAIDQFKTYADRKTGAAVIHVKVVAVTVGRLAVAAIAAAVATTASGAKAASGATADTMALRPAAALAGRAAPPDPERPRPKSFGNTQRNRDWVQVRPRGAG